MSSSSTGAGTDGSTTGGAAPIASGPDGAGPQPSIGQLVQEATTQLSNVLRGEIELAKIEITSSAKSAGTGIGAFIAAGAVFLFSLTFAFIALAEGLVAAGIWRWAAYLIVFGLLLLVVAGLVLLGVRKVKRVKAPTRTITSSKETVALLKRSSQHG